MIETTHDEVVTPYQSAFLTGAHVTNITLQDQCPLDFTDHLGIIYDRVALTDVLRALDPADAEPVPCTVVLPGLGGSIGRAAPSRTWQAAAVPDDAPRRVALVAPMPSELRPLVRTLELRRSRVGDLTVHTGTVGDVELVATRTGMGTATSAEVTAHLLDTVPVDHLCVVGIAGGLRPDVEIGTVVVPDTVIDHATGHEYHPARFGKAVPDGSILTSNELLGNDVLDRYGDRGVVAVDMETAAVGAVCEARGCPWSAFRSISDRTADGTVNDEVFGLANPDGSPNVGASLRFVFTHPWRIPGLLHLARDATIAAKAAAKATASACRDQT